MMPLLRYFTYVGGALMALMLVGSYVIPEPPTVPQHDAARPVIRITSDRVVPPRVDLDTSVQPVPSVLAQNAPQPQTPVRQAYAQLLSPPPAPALTAAAPAKPAAKGEVKKTKMARRPDRQLFAAYPQAAYPHVAAYPQGFQPFRWTW